MEQFILFLKPYLIFSFYGGHSLVSVLDALNIIVTSNFNLIDGRIISVYISIYFIVMIFIIIFQFIVSFSLSNRFAFILLFIWLSPGLLQVTELMDFDSFSRPTLYVGGDINDNIIGNLINAFLVVIFAWSIAILIIHIFKLGKKTKAIYDHFWYIFGLSSLVFFLLDYNKTRNYEMLEQTQKELIKAVKFIETDLVAVETYCTNKEFSIKFENICNWVKPAKYYIESLTFHDKITPFHEQKSIELNDLFKKIPNEKNIINLKNELIYLNEICRKNTNKFCKEVPFEMNMDPRLETNEISVFKKYIVRINPIMPYITIKWDRYKYYKLMSDKQNLMKYYKWFFFMFLSLVVGIKLAFTTREIFPVKDYSVYRSNIFKIFSVVVSLCKFIYSRIILCPNRLKLKD